MKRIHVVAAIILDQNRQKVLIAKRPNHVHQGGLWEFPGGKLEFGEQPQYGLARELKEELGIVVNKTTPGLQISHDYPDKHVLLDVWTVDDFCGTAVGKEGQLIRWVERDELSHYEFPEANQAILHFISSSLA